MSNLDQRILWVLAFILAMIARPALCEDSPIFEPFQDLLDRHLTEHFLPCGGLVSWFNYEGALNAPDTRRLLEQQDLELANFDPGNLTLRESALSFWINAYNYFMVQHLLTHPDEGAPVESVRDYGSLFRPYRVFGLKRFNVGGVDYSLREIELDILLGDHYAQRGWKDARIHFAVNCASVGCPPLRASVYTAPLLDATLTENTRLALSTPLHLKLAGETLLLSSLFDWYENDFADQNGSVLGFIEAYGSDAAAETAQSAKAIDFIDYDWRLNTIENFTTWIQ